MDYSRLITIDPGIRGGKPCIRGTRIAAYDATMHITSSRG